MNLPNKLTVLRIILVPFMVASLLLDWLPHHYLIAGIIFGIASLTDLFDGKIARKNNLITDFGKFADPLADKILVISAICCFVQLGITSCIVPIFILFREFSVTSIRLIASSEGKVIAANFWGKAKTVSQMTAIIVIFISEYFLELCNMNILPINPNLSIENAVFLINNIFLYVSVVFTVVSGVIYIKDNFYLIKNA